MLFDVDAALAEIVAHDAATLATTATNTPEMRQLSQMSPLSQRRTAENKPQPQPVEVAPFPTPEPPQPSRPAPSRPEPDAFPYGHSVDGQPLTWTGKVVSLAEWKRLSEWDKHGSTGKVWNGITRAWEPRNGGAA